MVRSKLDSRLLRSSAAKLLLRHLQLDWVTLVTLEALPKIFKRCPL